MRHRATSTVAAVGALAAGLALSTALAPAAQADSTKTADDQTVYLDPQTGDVTRGPGVPGRGAHKAGAQPAHGTQQLAVDPAEGRSEAVVQCDDGSLRMGRAETAPGQDARQALCSVGKH